MKYYLAGPMTGYPEFNVPAFREAKAELEKQGYQIALPVDIDNASQKEGWQWGDYLAEDIRLICNDCMGMVLLPEWIRSRGAKLEIACGLMQSLKFPEFEFRFYKNGKISDCIDVSRIELAWHWDWDTYSKVAEIAA